MTRTVWATRLPRSLVLVGLLGLAVTAGACGGASSAPRPPSRGAWVDQPVSFVVDGLTVYGTYRHPAASTSRVPAALLIAGSGPTDRNGNSPLEAGSVDTLKTVADWLSDDGVASLRYDKLGSGATGLGTYALAPDTIGIAPFEDEAAGALRKLAAEPGVDPTRLAVFGHSEGALFALLLATGQAGTTSPVRAVGLLEPLSLRYLNVISIQVEAQVAQQEQAGQITPAVAAAVRSELESAVTQLRTSGTVAADLPYGLASVLSPSTAKFLSEADRYDPAALVGQLPTTTELLLTCGTSDTQVSCPQVARLHDAAASTGRTTTLLTLAHTDHVLKVDPTGSPANYTAPLPFSPELKAGLATFVSHALNARPLKG